MRIASVTVGALWECIAPQRQHPVAGGARSAEQSAGLALFDRERGQIDSGWAGIWTHGRSPEVDVLLISYAAANAYIGDLRYDQRTERLPQMEAALAATRRRGHHSAAATTFGNLGTVYKALGGPQQDMDCYEQALTIITGANDDGIPL